MIALGVLVVAVVIVVVVTMVATPRRSAPGGHEGAAGGREVDERLAAWRDAGLLDDATVAAITDFERARSPVGERAAPVAAPVHPIEAGAVEGAHRPGVPAGVEALGYLGGALAVTGVLLLVGNVWDDLPVGGQLALSGGTAVGLVAGGAAVPERRDPAMVRLRAFLWTLSTAAVAVFAAVGAREVLDLEPATRVVAVVAAIVALWSGVLWAGRFRPLQQLVALAAVVVAIGAGVDQVTGNTGAGIAVWVAGAAMLGLGLAQRTTAPPLDLLVGAVSVAVGSVIAIGDDPGAGLLFPLATGMALTALALVKELVPRSAGIAVLGGVGGLVVLEVAPPTVGHFADEAAVATGAVVWLVGLAMVLVGVARATRAPILLEVLGALVLLAGCAVTAVEAPGVATLAGLGTALGLLGVSTLPGRVALSAAGALGLLVYVPWTIGWFFPGEGRVPLLISVSGVLIIGLAVLLARLGHRFGAELGPGRRGPTHA